MPAEQILSLVLLACVFGLAIWKRLNIGILALAAVLPLALVSHTDASGVFKNFDGKLVVLIAGVTLLFAHMKYSGALEWVVSRIFDIVGDRVFLLPWAVFIIGAALSTAGAFSTAPIALLVPMVAVVSSRTRHMFLINELAVIIGANMAGPSPLNPVGALIASIAEEHHVTYSKWGLWAIVMAIAVVVVAVLQFFFTQTQRGKAIANIKADVGLHAETHENSAASEGAGSHGVLHASTLERPIYALFSGLALIAFVVLVVTLNWDVGLTSVALATILQLVFSPDEKKILSAVPWNSIILLTGLLTYLGLMKAIGTMDTIQHEMLSIGSAALLLAALSYLTTLLCSIESSTLGVLGLVMPIAMSSFPDSSNMVWILGVIAAPAALMVVNPIHVAGTLVVAQAEEAKQARTFRLLLTLAITMGLIVPALLLIYPMTIV